MLVNQLVSAFATLIFVSTPISVDPATTTVANKPETIQEKIELYAENYGVSAEVISNIIMCESSMNPKAIGDGGYSRGLVQIHKKYHPHVTDEMAFNEDYAIDFLAKNIKKYPHWWTCNKILYGV